jgi:1,2-diacylglycerol 3-beta-galactosyltransferase
MDEDLPAVLIMGGGEGMGPIEATARALGDSLFDENLGEPFGQVLIICGRNKKLASKLQSIDWKVPVQVLIIFDRLVHLWFAMLLPKIMPDIPEVC